MVVEKLLRKVLATFMDTDALSAACSVAFVGGSDSQDQLVKDQPLRVLMDKLSKLAATYAPKKG